MGDEQKYPPGFTPHTDTLKLPKGFTPSNLEKKKEVGGVASLIGGEVGSSNPQSQKARLSNYLYGLKTEDQKKMAQPSGGVVLNKKLKKNERPFDQTTEEAVKSGYDKLNELMYSDDDRWKDPVKALHKDYENNPAATISALGLVQMSLADSGLHAKKVLADTHFGTDNNNLTTELLKQRADQYDRIAQPFRDIQFTYENKPTDSPEDDYNAKDKIYDAAIRAYANANPMFSKQAEAAGLDLNGSDLVNKIGAKDESRYGSAMPGQIMNHIINDTDFLDYIQNENPKLFNAVKSVSDNLLTDQRAFGVNVVANEISRERQKLGFNNPIVEFDDKQFRRENDLVAEKLYADDPVKMKLYRDEVSQNADELIDTPALLNSFANSAKGVYKGIGNTFSAPVTSIPSQIYKGWEQQANQVSAEPKGFSKFASGTGNVLGLVAALGGVSNVLGAGGAGFYSSRVVPFLAGSVPFAGDFWHEGVMKYPNNPTKAGISAGLQTILYGALSQKIFPAKEVEAAFSKIKPEVGKIVESLATNKITKEAAKQQSMTLLKKAFSQLGGGVKNAATISAELTAIQGASSAFDYFNMSDEEFKNHHPQGELADTFKSLFLDNLVLGNMTKYSEMRRGNKLLEESLYEAATNQKRYKRVIDEMEVTDPTISKEDMIGNLEFLSKLKAGLDRNGLSEKNQKRYLLEAAKERAIKSQRSQLPDENLTRKSEELLRHGQEVRQNILDDKPYDEQEIDQEVKPTTTDSDLLTTLQEMSEGDVKNQDLQFFIDQSSNAPHQFIENYGEGVTQELLDRATTEQLKKSLEDAKKFDGHPSVPILEHEISKREIDQQRELDMGTEPVSESPSEVEEMSDYEIENRMMEIEDKGGDMKEFNRLEKEMEKRERATVFSVPLENVSAAVDALVKKDKEQPNGYGSFIERRDASETKVVAERYLKPKLISDAELKNDFKEAVMGNPDTWYADGLKLRESLKEAANRGIDTSEMVAEVEKEFVKDGYTSEDAKATVARKLSKIFDGSQKVETNESKFLPENRSPEAVEPSKPTEETPTEQAPPEPPVAEPPVNNQISDSSESPERRFTKQMLRSDELSSQSKAEISKTLNYVKQTNEMNVKEANEVLDKVGLDEAQNLVMTDGNLKPSVRVTIGQILIKRYNDLADKATDQAEKDYYLDKTIQTASFVTEKLATEAGQSIQAFSMWSRLSPEGQLRAANQDMERQGKEKMARREKDINKVGDKFKKANQDAAEEVIKNTSNRVKKVESDRVSKAKERVAKAKAKRSKLFEKYKKGKGGGLTLSTGGLSKEGIEYVGELAKTYIEEGVAKLEVAIAEIIDHLKKIGANVTDDVSRHVSDLLSQAYDEKKNKDVSSALAELENEIGGIIRKHYTVPEDAKKKLVDKFVDQAGLEKEEAEKLAKEVEAEFEKIATRKKRDILYNEKARFDKINNTLKGDKAPEKKTVADDIIKYTNLGAFENSDLAALIADKFGIGKITAEQAAKLKELSDKIQKSPEGTPKRDATEDLLAYRAKLRGNDLGETVQGVWYANILSGYRTHEKNVISTFFNSVGELLSEMAKDPKAIPYIMSGYLKGILHRGRIEAANTVATGRSPIHIKKIETPTALERKQFKGGAINPANWLKYVMRMMVAEDVLSFQGLKEARAYQLARREASKMGYNTWSKKGWDKVNEILYHTKERYQSAQDQAKLEGLTGKREIKRRVYELMEESRPQKMTEDAYGFAAKGTFNHESEGSLGALTNAVAHALDAVSVGGVKPLRFIVPFTRIITNVVNNSLDFTPIGLVRGARGVRGFKSFNNNAYTKGAYKELSKEERQRYIAKASIGILLTATLQAMHQSGIIQITGAGPDDDKKRKQLQQSGWQPYSIKIGNKWYSYQYTPLVFMTGFLGNMNDAAEYGGDDEKTITKKMEIALSRMGGQVADMTWINSASTFLGALTDRSPSGQEKSIQDALAGTLRGAIPFGGAVTQVNQAVQNIFQMPQKQVNNSWQALIQDIPIARNMLNDKINALGDPITRDIDVFQSKETTDPVWKFLLDKQGWIAPPNRGTVVVFDQNTQQDRPLTNDEWYNFLVKRGSRLRKYIEKIMKNGATVVIKNKIKTVDPATLDEKELNRVLSILGSEATRKTKDEMFGEKEETVNESINKSISDAANELLLINLNK